MNPRLHSFYMLLLIVLCDVNQVLSGGSRNFKRGGGPGAVEFLGFEVCFDAPFTHTLCFVVKVKNQVHIVNIVWRIQIMYMRVIQSVIIYKCKLKNKKFKRGGGGGRPARRCWIRLWLYILPDEGHIYSNLYFVCMNVRV